MLKLPSPALGAIFQEIQSSDQNNLLDLGEMRAGTFNFFSQLKCKFHFENLRDFIIENRLLNNNNFEQKLNDYIRFDQANNSFNVVLTWDLFDYLSLGQIIILFRALDNHLRPNTLVHTLSYMTRAIPSSPSKFTILDDHTLGIELLKPAMSKPFHHTSMSLVKSMPGFMLETNLFSNNNVKTGIKEALLRQVSHMESAEKNLSKKNYSAEKISLDSDLAETYKNNLIRYQLPGLNNLLDDLRHKPERQLLDLGYDNKSNAKQLLNYCDSVTPETLASRIYHRDKDDKARMNFRSLNFGEEKLFDAVLTWDLFNYLSIEEIEEVLTGIRKHCKAGTLIHIICYATARIPQQPQAFSLIKDRRLVIKKTASEIHYKNKINSIKLLKLFNNAEIKYSFSMQKEMPKGMYELVFSYTG